MRKRWLLTWGLTGTFVGALLLAGATACLTSGCSSIGYYAQAAGGHIELLQRARPVAQAVADPQTSAATRAQLQLSQRLRDFAVQELQLPDNDSYRRYADLQREAVVWNVVAAPELSLTLKTWCFPVMGCVGYRGYFDRQQADALAVQLRAQGLEVNRYGVPAYSTLGWSNWLGGDPLLSTFINWPEAALAQLVFHELAHQVAYASDDTTFNESFAAAVERIGVQRWLQRHGGDAALAAFAAGERRRTEFRELTLRHRQALQQIYAGALPDAAKRAAKVQQMAALRADYGQLKAGPWNGYAGYDEWFAHANNASLGVLAAYNELVPDFLRLFEACGGDFTVFYTRVQALAARPQAERRARLAAAAP